MTITETNPHRPYFQCNTQQRRQRRRAYSTYLVAGRPMCKHCGSLIHGPHAMGCPTQMYLVLIETLNLTETQWKGLGLWWFSSYGGKTAAIERLRQDIQENKFTLPRCIGSASHPSPVDGDALRMIKREFARQTRPG